MSPPTRERFPDNLRNSLDQSPTADRRRWVRSKSFPRVDKFRCDDSRWKSCTVRSSHKASDIASESTSKSSSWARWSRSRDENILQINIFSTFVLSLDIQLTMLKLSNLFITMWLCITIFCQFYFYLSTHGHLTSTTSRTRTQLFLALKYFYYVYKQSFWDRAHQFHVNFSSSQNFNYLRLENMETLLIEVTSLTLEHINVIYMSNNKMAIAKGTFEIVSARYGFTMLDIRRSVRMNMEALRPLFVFRRRPGPELAIFVTKLPAFNVACHIELLFTVQTRVLFVHLKTIRQLWFIIILSESIFFISCFGI